MLIYRNFLCDRDDMAGKVRKIIETNNHFISEWRNTDIIEMIKWHEEYLCKILHIVSLDYGLISVISDKSGYKLSMLDKLLEYKQANPGSVNLLV